MSLLPIGLSPADPLVPIVAWAARALTFFNVLVLLWLGLTVLLTAERRSVGTWLAGGGLLLGGLCSIARASAQAAQPITIAMPLDPWWRASWLPFAGASYLWSVVLSWYAGHLRTRTERRNLLGFSALGVVVFLLLLNARTPLVAPPLSQLLPPGSSWSPGQFLSFESAPGDAYLALAAYLAFTLLCVGNGLHALYSPRSPDRFMGELASRRARPWLTATSLVTLGLSLVVGFGTTGVMLVTPLALFDLLGALLLAGQAMLLGQAVVSYEVFTGKTLPRRGLARYWRNALILAAGFGGLMALSLGLPLDQSYRLLLALVIVAIFYALLSWRSFVERERSLEQLRPFVASERLVDHLLAMEEDLIPQPFLRRGEGEQTPDAMRAGAMNCAPTGSREVGARFVAPEARSDPFRALCDDLLGASVGYLCPVGLLASLVGAPLAAPETAVPPSTDVLTALVGRIESPRQLCLPIEPAEYGGAAWAVPLWGERGLSGLLLLGARRGGSLYAQEEIEIARAAGERLIDARAASELARRLLLLQRRRLVEDQLLDGRVRRALHDDVLPLLHTALLALNGGEQEAAGLLADAHRQVSGLLAALPPALAPDVARLGLVGALRRVADDLGGELDAVTWEIEPEGERAAAELSPLAAEVLFGAAREAIRNAARHARGPEPDQPAGTDRDAAANRDAAADRGAVAGRDAADPDSAGDSTSSDARRPLHLRIAVSLDRADLTLLVEDDGIGPGGSGTPGERPGGGQGLVLHGTLLTVIGGSLAVERAPGHGTRVMLRVPAPE